MEIKTVEKIDCADVTLLKKRIELYVILEEYERAAKLKQWIEEIKKVKDYYNK